MSAGRCPVDGEPKERRWHLVCPYCWVKVPDADKEEIYRLYQEERGSNAHREKCFSVVRALLEAAKKVSQEGAA